MENSTSPFIDGKDGVAAIDVANHIKAGTDEKWTEAVQLLHDSPAIDLDELVRRMDEASRNSE